jgi:hypothetical protein
MPLLGTGRLRPRGGGNRKSGTPSKDQERRVGRSNLRMGIGRGEALRRNLVSSFWMVLDGFGLGKELDMMNPM